MYIVHPSVSLNICTLQLPTYVYYILLLKPFQKYLLHLSPPTNFIRQCAVYCLQSM